MLFLTDVRRAQKTVVSPRHRSRSFAILTAAALLLSSLAGGMAVSASAAEPNAVLTIAKTTATAEVYPGEPFVWEISIGCQSLDAICEDAVFHDTIPAEFIVKDVRVVGTDKTPVIERDGNDVTVSFTETSTRFPGVKGMWDGQKLTVLVSAALKDDTPAARDGDKVTNTGSVVASNAAEKTSPSTVTLRVPPRVSVDTTKKWSPDRQIVGDTAPTTVTVTVANTSNIPADTLRLTEPTTGFTPFDSVAFQGFGTVRFPAGADRVGLTVIAGGKTAVVPPAASLVFPSSIDPATVTGLVIEFSSSQGAAKLLAAGAGGSVGSVDYTVTQRASLPRDSETTVLNRVAGSVATSRDSATSTADDTLRIAPQTSVITAKKSFTPTSVDQGGSSVVVVGAVNDSNTPVTSLTITEPAATTPHLVQNGLVFVGFGALGDGKPTAGTWPSGATEASVRYLYADGYGAATTVTSLDKATWPTPAAKPVLGFAVVFTGAVIVPGAQVGLPFLVKTTSATPPQITNVVQADATGPAGPATPSTAPASLTTTPLAISSSIDKTLNVNTGVNIAGQQFLVGLTATPTGNAPVTKLVLEDKASSAFWTAFSATRLVSMTVPSTATLEVHTWNGTAWVTVPGAEALTGSPTISLPAGAKGVQFVYTAKAGSELARGTAVTAKFVASLDAAQPYPNGATEAKFENCATSTVSGAGSISGPGTPNNDCETVRLTAGTGGGGNPPTPTPIVKVDASKSWGTSPLLIPADSSTARPSTTLTIKATNKSPILATSLSLEEPTAGTTPFDSLNLTNIQSVKLPDGADKSKTLVQLRNADGSFAINGTGEAFVTAALALSKEQLANVVSIVIVANGSFAFDASNRAVTVNATVQLREETRGASTPIVEALTINNTVTATVSDGTGTATKDASAALSVVKEIDAPLAADLTKTLNGTSGTVYTQGERTVKLGLEIKRNQGDPVRYEIVDTEPTFWNAFRLTAGDVKVSNPGGAKSDITVRIDYLRGATFSTTGGALSATGGSWVEGVPYELPGGTTTVPSANLPVVIPSEVHGVRISFVAANGTLLNRESYRAEFSLASLTTLRSGGPVTDNAAAAMPGETVPGVVTNWATASVSNATKKIDVPKKKATFTFVAGSPAVTISKTPKINSLVPGEEVGFKLTVKNTGSTAIVNPVITDVIPHDLVDALLVYDGVRNTAASFSVNPSSASITTDPSRVTLTTDEVQPEGTTRESEKQTRLAFSFPAGSVLLPGEEYTITVPMKVRAGVERDTVFLNTFIFTADGGIRAETTATITVLEGGSYWRTKDVKENVAEGVAPTGLYNTLDKSSECVSDDGFYRVPCVVKTQPGGSETWRLRVTNTGNLSASTLTIVDVFPYPGDTGVSDLLSSIQRGSTWTPEYLGDLTFADLPDGTTTTVSYQTAKQTRCVMGDKPNSSDPFGTTCVDWSSTAPADLSTVTGLKVQFDFAEKLAPGEGVALTYQTKTPTALPRGVDPYLANGTPAPAWNSFVAFTTTIKGNGKLDYETLEPNKAGIAYATRVAVGDFVWVDKDRNGVQDEGEPGLEGVSVTLLDAAGATVGTAVTDAKGYYLFDELPAGEYSVTFALTEAQQKKYAFTAQGAGTNRALDSDADALSGSSGTFTLDAGAPNMVPAADYTIARVKADFVNPTIDAGVVALSVRVGDYVWFDTNKDGIQGSPEDVLDEDGVTVLEKAEPGIPGIVLKLTGPDGTPVTDVFGDEVAPVTTDEDGFYLFPNLPPLLAGDSYRVTIDQAASAKVIGELFSTKTEQGDDRTRDSSRNFALSGDLTVDGSEDLSLDFGFYSVDLPTFPLPEGPGGLVVTGAVAGPALMLLMMLLGGGVTLLLVARFRTPARRGRHS